MHTKKRLRVLPPPLPTRFLVELPKWTLGAVTSETMKDGVGCRNLLHASVTLGIRRLRSSPGTMSPVLKVGLVLRSQLIWTQEDWAKCVLVPQSSALGGMVASLNATLFINLSAL
jgi:hypothetical protein